MSTVGHPTQMRLWQILAIAGSMAAMVMAIGTTFGFYLAQSSTSSETQAAAVSATQLKLLADSASRGTSMSLATGRINGDVEALFILDHLTGDLQCWLLNPKTGDVGGIYKTNVAGLAGAKGEPDYIMATGGFFFDGRKNGNMIPAQTIVYVAEGNTGKVAGFSLTYNKSDFQRGIAQSGLLEVVCEGPARDMVQRDQ